MLLGNESWLDWRLYQSRADYMDHELERHRLFGPNADNSFAIYNERPVSLSFFSPEIVRYFASEGFYTHRASLSLETIFTEIISEDGGDRP